MDKQTIYITAGVILVGALIGGGFYAMLSPKTESLVVGAFLTSSVTNTSSSVGLTDTLVFSPPLQFFYAKNRGGANIDCAWTTTSTLTGASVGTGLRFDNVNVTTSTDTSRVITDPNLLAKYMHCIADGATTSLDILKY